MTESHNNPVVLTSTASEPEAAVLIAYLRDEGVPAEMMGGLTAGFRAEAIGYVQVLVRAEDEAHAKTLLEAFNRDKPEIDWSQVDVGEPEDMAEVPFKPTCEQCGYDLRGTIANRCPECGWTMNADFEHKLRQFQKDTI